jgi:hypothetical protein
VSVAGVVRAVLPPVVATALFLLAFMRPARDAPVQRAGRMARVALEQKDANFRVIPRARGGATGAVWYTPSGPELRIQYRAVGLVPDRRYLIEIAVDSTIYSVASHVADASGDLALDTVLTRFAEGACVGANFDAPRAMLGRHRVRFWLKRDGSPRDGVVGGPVPGSPGASLPCRGNGDGDYTYVLLENAVAEFTGTPR